MKCFMMGVLLFIIFINNNINAKIDNSINSQYMLFTDDTSIENSA